MGNQQRNHPIKKHMQHNKNTKKKDEEKRVKTVRARKVGLRINAPLKNRTSDKTSETTEVLTAEERCKGTSVETAQFYMLFQQSK